MNVREQLAKNYKGMYEYIPYRTFLSKMTKTNALYSYCEFYD